MNGSSTSSPYGAVSNGTPQSQSNFLPMAPQAVSSTEVRERLALGESPESLEPELIPVSVARYIANHQLYASGAPL